jgi:TonB family protein
MILLSHSRHPTRPALLAGAFAVSVVVNAAASVGFTHIVRRGDVEVLDPTNRFDAFEVFAVPDEDAPARTDDVRQMVSLARPDPEEAIRPDEADYADRFERSVDEETVNRDDQLDASATESEPGTNRIEGGADVQASATRLAPQQARERDEPDAEGVSERIARVAVSRPPDEIPGDHRPTTNNVDGSRDEPRNETPDGDPVLPLNLTAFRPTAGDVGTLQGGTVGTRRNDYLALAEGERTQVNSYRSMYWSFFDRMQNRLSQEWDPRSVLRVEDPSGLLYGRQDRLTILSVTLESDGALRHAVVERTSGLDFLDAEAVRAFEAAAPFANVPEGLKDERGRATFRFGFHVDYGRSPVIRRLDL